MKTKELDVLKKYYGDWDKVGQALGISMRQVYRLVSGEQEPTKPIKKLIAITVQQIKLSETIQPE